MDIFLYYIKNSSGFFPMWWSVMWLLLVFLTHQQLVATSLYLHRAETHLAIKFHPVVAHFFRFWLWFTTAQVTKQWVSVHRKHHAHVERVGDPHSPKQFGIWKVLFFGWLLYRKEAHNKETLAKYGHGTPNDWIERNLYTPCARLVPTLGFLTLVCLFGFVKGLVMFAVMGLLIPALAAGIINGLGHFWGYRRFALEDNSRNITSKGILIVGEELHNNHHEDAAAANFSRGKGEVDLGWWYIQKLKSLGLAHIRKVA